VGTRSLGALKAPEAAQPSNKFRTRLHDLPTQALEEEANIGVKVTGNQFKENFCLPMKRRELWISSQKNTNFLELWPLTPACSRLERMLATNAGRMKILNCVRANVGLSGDPKRPEVRGIEECHIVIDELLQVRAEKLKATTAADATATPPGDGGVVSGASGVPGAGGAVPGAGGAVPGEEADGLSLFEAASNDPVEQKANELSLKEMMHINYFPDVETLMTEVEESVSREPVEQPHPTD
jgi:hypothetical protein